MGSARPRSAKEVVKFSPLYARQGSGPHGIVRPPCRRVTSPTRNWGRRCGDGNSSRKCAAGGLVRPCAGRLRAIARNLCAVQHSDESRLVNGGSQPRSGSRSTHVGSDRGSLSGRHGDQAGRRRHDSASTPARPADVHPASLPGLTRHSPSLPSPAGGEGMSIYPPPPAGEGRERG